MPIIQRNPKIRLAEKAREDTRDTILPQGEIVAYTLPVKIDRVYGKIGEVVDDDSDVYAMSIFPVSQHGTVIVKFTPRQLFDCIEEYSVNPESFKTICRKHGINDQGAYRMMRRYTQIKEHYERCQKARADVLVDNMTDIAEDNSGDLIEGPKGMMVNHASVKRSELRIKNSCWQAERLNQKYMEKRGLDVKEFAVHTNINLPAPKDLQSFDVNDLASIFGK